MTDQARLAAVGRNFEPSLLAPDFADRFARPLLAAFVVILSFWLAFTQRIFMDGDTSWHVAAGRYMLQTFQIPDVDVFSFTNSGRRWVPHEWLSELVMACTYNAGGWRGLNLLFAFAGGATALLLGRELMRWLPARWALCVLFVIVQLLSPTAVARPHMLVWPLLAGWLILLLHAREAHRAPNPMAALIMAVWVNCHASYVVGLGLAGLFVLDAFVSGQYAGRELRRWFLFLLVAAASACVTPNGIDGFLYPFQVSSMTSLSLIGEWRRTNFHEDKLFIMAATVVWALSIIKWRSLDLVRAGILVGTTAMAFAHARHQSLFAVLVPLGTVALPRERGEEIVRTERFHVPLQALIGAGAGALLIARMAVPLTLRENAAMPLGAMAHIPERLRSQPVFNEYSYGGPLILAGIKPYIDGRADMYGDAYSVEYARIVRGDVEAFRRADQRWRFAWVIIPWTSGLAPKLAKDRAWRTLYHDERTVVFVPAGREHK